MEYKLSVDDTEFIIICDSKIYSSELILRFGFVNYFAFDEIYDQSYVRTLPILAKELDNYGDLYLKAIKKFSKLQILL